jgi:hypothetical protein
MAAHHSAQGLASLGRHGDSMLVHMSPHEVAGLNYLAKKQGTKLTINPQTGLPEAFSLGGLFSSILPMFAGSFFPGAGFGMEALLAGAATGAGLAAAKGDNIFMGGLTGGLGGISGSNLAQGLGGAASGAVAGASTPYSMAGGWVDPSTIGAMTGPQMPGAALANTGLNTAGASMMNNPLITNAGNTINQAGFMNSAMSGSGNLIDRGLDKMSTMGSGAKSLFTNQPGAVQGFKNAFIDPATGTGALSGTGMAMKIGMPIGGAVLGGLEPSDIYGEPMQRSNKEKYDPYATLNLSGDTGLRLYAAGGNVNTNTSSIASGGLQDLYGTSDNSGAAQALSQDGYGVGRLESLTSAGSQAKAADMFYAQGGPVSFADGGDSNKEGVALEQLSVPTDAVAPSAGGIAALTNSAQMGQAPSDVNLNAPPTATDGSIITQVANNLKVDPNYQGKNPIEAAIVKQLKGTDPMQQSQQGLPSLAPTQPSFPTAATYAPTQAMTPTYFAGMNAPGSHMAKGGYLDGQGDGMSDSIPATIEGKQPARLADGEFVVPADVVSHIGNGSSKAGSKRLYAMLDKVRKARTGHTKQGKEINPNKYMPA